MPAVPRPDALAVENVPQCGVLARKMLRKPRPMMAGYNVRGTPVPTFRIIYREAQ
ncbi:hypothetical protein GCM10007857_72160 [Bradyrhizobium iriomotense]|uniref:Uncharacterized protein n=1 Tax=Bradyrhizobium iriomotense TaxID=441950 RepID=A0ABQ6BCX2_9BRAD|nr:hypothetical protein GCM10007857_72160 [Bradyrhizobium iriomotense]